MPRAAHSDRAAPEDRRAMARERLVRALRGADIGNLVVGAAVEELDLAVVNRVDDESEINSDVAHAFREAAPARRRSIAITAVLSS